MQLWVSDTHPLAKATFQHSLAKPVIKKEPVTIKMIKAIAELSVQA